MGTSKKDVMLGERTFNQELAQTFLDTFELSFSLYGLVKVELTNLDFAAN